MSNIIRIFLIFFSLKNTNLGAHFLLVEFCDKIYANSQNSTISFEYVDSQAKIFLILYPPFEYSTTRTAIVPTALLNFQSSYLVSSSICNQNDNSNDNSKDRMLSIQLTFHSTSKEIKAKDASYQNMLKRFTVSVFEYFCPKLFKSVQYDL